MKKTVFTLLLMLATAIAGQAQSEKLTRTAWSTMLPGDEEMEMVLNFDDDGECYIILTSEEYQDLDDGASITIRQSLSVPGIFNKSGRNITVSFNKRKAEFNLSYDIYGADEQTKNMVKLMLTPELKKMEPEIKQEMLDLVPAFMDDMKVISVNKERLILGDGEGERMTFYPAAKG